MAADRSTHRGHPKVGDALDQLAALLVAGLPQLVVLLLHLEDLLAGLLVQRIDLVLAGINLLQRLRLLLVVTGGGGCVAIGGGAVQLGSLWHARHSARSSGVCTLVIPEIFEQKAAVQLSRREAKRIFNLSFAAEEL